MVTIPGAKKAIKLAWEAGQIPALIGAAGIGKTQTIEQCLKELESESPGSEPWGFRSFYTPLTPPEKFQGLAFRSRHNPDTVQTLIDEELAETLSSAKQGVILIDELNRADDDTLKAIFVLLSERRTGSFELPAGWRIACAMNPSGGDYKVNEVFTDPAMRRRLCYIGLRADVQAWVTYARSANFHSSVIDFVVANPEMLLDEKTRDVGKQYANPAGWEKVSDQLKAMAFADPEFTGDPVHYVPKDSEDLYCFRQVMGGTVGTNMAGEFVEFIKDAGEVMLPTDVLNHYAEPESEISIKVARSLGAVEGAESARHDKVVALIKGVVVAMFSTMPEPTDTLARNFGQFTLDLPEEMRSLLNTEVQAASEKSTEAQGWLKRFLHGTMMSSNAYRTALLTLHESHEELERSAGGNLY